jgi:hypothetical protein
MKDEKDKELDALFKRRLEDPVSPAGYREEDWGNLEQMLDRHQKRRGIIFLLPYLSGVAALLLLFLGWWAFRPKTTSHPKEMANVVVHHQQAPASAGDKLISQDTTHQSTAPLTAPAVNYAQNANAARVRSSNNSNSKLVLPLSIAGSFRDTAANYQNDTPAREFAATLDAASPVLLVKESITPQPINADNIPQQFANAVKASTALADNKIKVKAPSAFRPRYALTVLAAPDINGVGSFQQSKVGTNVGLLFSAGVFKKFTVSTGALYSVKPYYTDFGNYHTPYQFPVSPTSVLADCRMLDIPLNVGYQLYSKHQNKFSIGTGLSSYIMLHEAYSFTYAAPYTIGPSNFVVPNSDKYFFGVLNLNATYEHQLNSKVGLSVQPYLKLPLTNIGYSQVRLQTTGVAVGLSWNLSSAARP